MVAITIQGQSISFPNSGGSPNWAPAVIEFAQAVELALSGLAGDFDVAPQTFDFDSSNPGSNLNIPNLSFPTSDVRGATIDYAIHRETSTVELAEKGKLEIVYNASNTGDKWEVVREFVGDADVTFDVTDTGQVQLSTTTIAGINHAGRITYSAKALKQTS